jgi:Zn-dependent protease with chaperone function
VLSELFIATNTGLIRLGHENKSDFDPDWLYAAYHYSHPPLIERLRAIDMGAVTATPDAKKQK